jgi:hypothetical protein
VLLALLAPRRASADKTDVLVLANGDRVTGEIMSVARGKLDLKTDDAGRLSIDWIKVQRVTSTHVFDIETVAATRHFSALPDLPEEVRGQLQLADGSTIPIPEVVSMVPVDAGIASRLTSFFDLGFTFAKANQTTNLSADGLLGYRGESMGSTLTLSGYLLDSTTSQQSIRTSTSLTGDLYFGRWTAQLGLGTDRNDELSLDLRVSVGAGALYTAIRTNAMVLTARGGVSALLEKYTTGDPARYLTGYLAVDWEAFRYQHPKLDAGISLAAYPYLTDPGRVRIEGTARVKYEILSDFNVGVTLNDSWDSRPPEGSTQNDLVVTATIGWSYRR